MFERLNRRLEILSKQIKDGPKLKPGFSVDARGMMSFDPPYYVPEVEVDPMTVPLEIGDEVEVVYGGAYYMERGFVTAIDGRYVVKRHNGYDLRFKQRSSVRLVARPGRR